MQFIRNASINQKNLEKYQWAGVNPIKGMKEKVKMAATL